MTDDIDMILGNLIHKDVDTINQELSNLLDFTQKDVKKFLKEFIERVQK